MDTPTLEDLLREVEQIARQLDYAVAIREVLTPEAIAAVTERAREDAEHGDGSARRWLRQFGAAGAAQSLISTSTFAGTSVSRMSK